MTDYSHLTEYQQRALITRRRRAAADKRFAAEVAARRVAFQAKLDAIVAGLAKRIGRCEQAIDSDLYPAEDGIEEDYEFIRHGGA